MFTLVFSSVMHLVQQIGDKIGTNRSFCDKSAKFSGNVRFNPLIEIGYGPIA